MPQQQQRASDGAGAKSSQDAPAKKPDPKRAHDDRAAKDGVGAHGSREKPKTDEGAPKWPGGGKKGEDE